LSGNVSAAGTASVRQGTATPGIPTVGPSANQITVPLTNVTNAQHLVVTLDGVQNASSAILNNLVARMDVLLGDVNANGLVDGNDVSAVQGQTRHQVSNTNFRDDVNANGIIDGNDVSITQGQTRTSLP
jgi:hypothetical protein